MGRLHRVEKHGRGGLWPVVALAVLVLFSAGRAAAQCCACDECAISGFCVDDVAGSIACATLCTDAGCDGIVFDDMDSCAGGCDIQPELPTATVSQTPTGTPTGTATATVTATPTAAATDTATTAPSATATATGTTAATATVTSTGAASATATATGQASATSTVTGQATATTTATGQATPTATATGQATATATITGQATATATITGQATATVTITGQATATSTATGQATATRTSTVIATPTATGSAPATPTVTSTGQATATATASGTVTPTGGAISIDVGTASGQPGSTVGFAVTLAFDDDFEIASTRNCIDVDLDVPFASVTVMGVARPDCTVNPALQKPDSTFVFAPAGCDPTTTCESMCADIHGPVASPVIPEGAMLYSCRIAIPAATAVGTYPLVCGGPNSATNAGGNQVPANCQDGEVIVQTNLPGDCNGDGVVTIDELILGVNIALNLRPVADCPAFDTDFSGSVSVGELIAAVNVALRG